MTSGTLRAMKVDLLFVVVLVGIVWFAFSFELSLHLINKIVEAQTIPLPKGQCKSCNFPGIADDDDCP